MPGSRRGGGWLWGQYALVRTLGSIQRVSCHRNLPGVNDSSTIGRISFARRKSNELNTSNMFAWPEGDDVLVGDSGRGEMWKPSKRTTQTIQVCRHIVVQDTMKAHSLEANIPFRLYERLPPVSL